MQRPAARIASHAGSDVPAASASASASGAAGCMRTRWSIAAPAADCPPSFSHSPGSIAEKYGPQTPSTKAGSSVVAIEHADVPKT